jgi:hypothetical protein
MKKLALIISILSLASFSIEASKPDKLEGLRTEKKIISVDKATAPYYAIQILALKLPPQDPNFFSNINEAREFSCADGYVRYVVGQYNSFKEANADLEKIKALGYQDAFVVNTNNLGAQKVAGDKLVVDPNKTYTLQIGAFRFPVYLTYFDKVDNVKEYYMQDKIYRYCIGEHLGSIVESELQKIKDLGYKDAHIVELSQYLPYQIE